MKKLNYKELKELWLSFYKERGHAIIPSASVVPENDASVLFTNSGMHPLVPYLMGEKHPDGMRLANIQRCIRTGDIEDVGDPSHLTYFEMLGNWSLGDYFKKEKIGWTYEFLVSPKYLGIDSERIYVTCFAGNENAPKDMESANFWMEKGIPLERISFLPAEDNWWQLPSGTGPCGPCTESFMKLPCGRLVEIGNDVFMQFSINAKGEKPILLNKPSVDTGYGLERLLCMSQGVKSVYETELFKPALELILQKFPSSSDDGVVVAARILAEHTRAAMVIIADGVVPSNSGRGYVLRRLIRRAARMANKLGFTSYQDLINTYKYLEIELKIEVFIAEIEKFNKTLSTGLREFEKIKQLDGKTAFRLYETYGFPIELTMELAKERGLKFDIAQYHQARVEHSKQSQTASSGSFKGGLADTSGETTKLHTAAHILLSVLRKIYGDVHQKGSNITPERLRFDFNIDHKLTQEELVAIENCVNAIIKQSLPVTCDEMSYEGAQKLGAIGVFNAKYGKVVKIWRIGEYSIELCGGPHVQNTSELGVFKIQKEEGVSAGVRRIKATLL